MTTGSQPVLVLGAGINGCAIARELLLNGVAVWLVDASDIACGATSGSSRLIHGGLRYLEYGEFDLVKESLAERTRLLRLAPQFVRPLRLWIPAATRFGGTLASVGRFFGWQWWPWKSATRGRGVMLIRAGLAMYDTYARQSTLPAHQVCPVDVPDAPSVDNQKYRWLCAYSDGQVVFPERLAVALIEDAQRLSQEKGLEFRVHTYCQATLRGDTVELGLSGDAHAGTAVGTLQPAAIVNATGAWVDETLTRLDVPAERLMGGTKGSHLFSAKPELRDALADQGIYAEAEDGRPIFITPLADTVLIGTTDVPIQGSPSNVQTSEAERDYLIDSVNAILPSVRLSLDDVDFHTSAVRPLPYVPATSPGAITRRHKLVENNAAAIPLLSVVGGKLTTMRALAELTTEAVLKQLGREVQANSQQRVFPGGEDYPPDTSALASTHHGIAERTGFSQASVAAAWRLHGTRTEAILATASDTTLLDGTELPVALAKWSIQNEWTTCLADLVERRLMLLYHQRLTTKCLKRLAELLAARGLLGTTDAASAAATEAARLSDRYGKHVV